jgi:hypothetical protein
VTDVLICDLRSKKNKAMKYLFLAINVNSCDNDDESSRDPSSRPPPLTQTGANTFGALLDGEPFIPGGVSNPLICFYQLINGDIFWFRRSKS